MLRSLHLAQCSACRFLVQQVFLLFLKLSLMFRSLHLNVASTTLMWHIANSGLARPPALFTYAFYRLFLPALSTDIKNLGYLLRTNNASQL